MKLSLVIPLLCFGCAAPKPFVSFRTMTSRAQPASVIQPATIVKAPTTVHASWAPPHDNEEPVEGYKLYYGLSPRDYETNLDCGMETNGVVEGLTGWTTYYFSVSAVYAHSEDFSAETAFTPALILELRFPNPGILQSSTDLVNWEERDAAFDGNVYRVSDPKWPMEFYRTTTTK